MDNNLNDSDLHHVPKKSKKKIYIYDKTDTSFHAMRKIH